MQENIDNIRNFLANQEEEDQEIVDRIVEDEEMHQEDAVATEQEHNEDGEEEDGNEEDEEEEAAYDVTDFEGDEFQFPVTRAARMDDINSATGRNPYANTIPTTENEDVDMPANDEEAPEPEGVIVAMVTESPTISSWDINSDQEPASSDSDERLHYAPPPSEVRPTPTPIADYVDFMDKIEFGDPKHGGARQPCPAYTLGDEMRPPKKALKYANWKIKMEVSQDTMEYILASHNTPVCNLFV